MPVTTAYVTAKITLIRLRQIDASLEAISNLLLNIKGLINNGLTEVEANNIISAYKAKVLAILQREIASVTDEAIATSLAAAVESDDKNALLTPVIAGIPVNPALGANLSELQALIADGVLATNTLFNLISKINQTLN